MLEPLLEIADSSMTYRRRYFAQPQLRAGAATCCSPTTRTRARLAFQLARLSEHIRHLPRDPKAPSPTREERLIAHARRHAAAGRSRHVVAAEVRTRRRSRALDGAARTRSKTTCGRCPTRSPTSTSATRSCVSVERSSRCSYDVVHTTEYDYSESVSVSHHVARLKPRDAAASGVPAARAADRARAGRDEHARGLLRQRA